MCEETRTAAPPRAASTTVSFMSRMARGSRPVIVVTPCGFTNTNELKPETYPYYDPSVLEEYGSRRMDFDGPGMEKILETVRTRWGGEEKVFLTGFSGGGMASVAWKRGAPGAVSQPA